MTLHRSIAKRMVSVALTAGLIGAASGTAWAAHHEKGEGGGHKGHHGKHFDKRDGDGDGALSKQEWLAGAEKRFEKLDADGDGSITREEYREGHRAMRERHKKHHGHE